MTATAREEAGFKTMEEYILRQQNTVAPYINTQSLLELCEGSERAPGAQGGLRWWEQAGINLTGAREAAAAAAEAEEDGGGKVTEGTKRKTPGTEHQKILQVAKLTHLRTESSVYLASVQGVEHQ